MKKVPFLIQFRTIGSLAEGFISTTQQASVLPFSVKRVFWTYHTPTEASRGNHANKETEEVLVAVKGSITVKAEMAHQKYEFLLDAPNIGLYIPAMCWTNLKFSDDAIAVCVASTDFAEDDYVRDYQVFKSLS
ncbi:sugar 3,4-ketoisomerase [Pontibacter harenae]|uniref:sugar 3,4-ketoisomerase n=1 Tax=Pontibacter harenae TaxID=2894083 RepID=UPI001E3B88C1|nr:FdtA/QdtA family cupin domain-containing protein [Pontibacter harenae]MCC9166009.1 FdtA/QdtA family cupin domain-containing protein [Pontibacter harenae]